MNQFHGNFFKDIFYYGKYSKNILDWIFQKKIFFCPTVRKLGYELIFMIVYIFLM